jgi:hypothetical protein
MLYRGGKRLSRAVQRARRRRPVGGHTPAMRQHQRPPTMGTRNQGPAALSWGPAQPRASPWRGLGIRPTWCCSVARSSRAAASPIERLVRLCQCPTTAAELFSRHARPSRTEVVALTRNDTCDAQRAAMESRWNTQAAADPVDAERPLRR